MRKGVVLVVLVVWVLMAGCAARGPQTPAAKWRQLSPLPVALSHVASAVAGGKIYLMAGSTDLPQPTVQRYDPAGDRWEKLADLPVAVDHAMAAAVGDDVLLFGGFVRYGEELSARAFRYDARRNAWREIAALPEPVAAGSAAVLGGTVYVLGGWGNHKAVFAYDPAADRWRHVTDLPAPRDHLLAVTIGQRVCAIGGRGQPTAFACYDPKSSRWETLDSLPQGVDDDGAAMVDGAVWVAGRIVLVYDGHRWQTGPALPTPRWGLGVAAVGKTLYAISGVDLYGKRSDRLESLTLP